MGRTVNEATITTRNGRSKLAVSKTVHWRAIDRGLHIGYRRGQNGGTWIARYRKEDRTYVTDAIGKADDVIEADGSDILSYSQAQKAIVAWGEGQRREDHGISEPTKKGYTVGDAMADYMKWFKANKKSADRTGYIVDAHILPTFKKIELAKLSPKRIEQWLFELADKPPRLRVRKGVEQKFREMDNSADARRSRRASANRALTVLKAALNYALRDGKISSDEGWKRVKPLAEADAPRIRYLTAAEIQRLLNASPSDLRHLIQGALLTGCRYGELAELLCRNFDDHAGSIHISQSKSGKPRNVPLNDEGVRFFSSITAGRKPDDRIFLRDGGKAWGRSHQQRPLDTAAAIAKVDDVSFHVLRHTYGSMLAMQGVPMAVIAVALGHSDTRMTERHYAHLAPSYVNEMIRKNLPSLGIRIENNITKIA